MIKAILFLACFMLTLPASGQAPVPASKMPTLAEQVDPQVKIMTRFAEFFPRLMDQGVLPSDSLAISAKLANLEPDAMRFIGLIMDTQFAYLGAGPAAALNPGDQTFIAVYHRTPVYSTEALDYVVLYADLHVAKVPAAEYGKRLLESSKSRQAVNVPLTPPYKVPDANLNGRIAGYHKLAEALFEFAVKNDGAFPRTVDVLDALVVAQARDMIYLGDENTKIQSLSSAGDVILFIGPKAPGTNPVGEWVIGYADGHLQHGLDDQVVALALGRSNEQRKASGLKETSALPGVPKPLAIKPGATFTPPGGSAAPGTRWKSTRPSTRSSTRPASTPPR